MKGFCIALAVLCLLTACGRKAPSGDLQAATRNVTAIYAADELRLADDDFVLNNFGALDYVERAEVYLSANGDGTEIGFFQLTDTSHTGKMKSAIREYLESERRSVESLAALYPGEELNRRLSRFDSATVAESGTLVYYIVAASHDAQKIQKAIQN